MKVFLPHYLQLDLGKEEWVYHMRKSFVMRNRGDGMHSPLILDSDIRQTRCGYYFYHLVENFGIQVEVSKRQVPR